MCNQKQNEELFSALGDVNRIKQKEKNELLIYAVDRNQEAIVKLAIALGADISARHFKAIRLALKKGHMGILRILIKSAKDISSVEDLLWDEAKRTGDYYLFSIVSKKKNQ